MLTSPFGTEAIGSTRVEFKSGGNRTIGSPPLVDFCFLTIDQDPPEFSDSSWCIRLSALSTASIFPFGSEGLSFCTVGLTRVPPSWSLLPLSSLPCFRYSTLSPHICCPFPAVTRCVQRSTTIGFCRHSSKTLYPLAPIFWCSNRWADLVRQPASNSVRWRRAFQLRVSHQPTRKAEERDLLILSCKPLWLLQSTQT